MRTFCDNGNSNSPKQEIWKHWLQNSKQHMYVRTANNSVDPFTYTCKPTIQLCLTKKEPKTHFRI